MSEKGGVGRPTGGRTGAKLARLHKGEAKAPPPTEDPYPWGDPLPRLGLDNF
jgi:hypothetical protein